MKKFSASLLAFNSILILLMFGWGYGLWFVALLWLAAASILGELE